MPQILRRRHHKAGLTVCVRREGTPPHHYGTKRVLLAYDRDEAGEKAEQSLAEKLIGCGLEGFYSTLPFGSRVKSHPRPDLLPKTADVLGVEIVDLLFDDVARFPRCQHIVRLVSALVMQYERGRRGRGNVNARTPCFLAWPLTPARLAPFSTS